MPGPPLADAKRAGAGWNPKPEDRSIGQSSGLFNAPAPRVAVHQALRADNPRAARRIEVVLLVNVALALGYETVRGRFGIDVLTPSRAIGRIKS
jgi:hypothetical protein